MVTGIMGFQENQIALGTLNFRISRTLFGSLPSFGCSGFSFLTPGLAPKSQTTSPRQVSVSSCVKREGWTVRCSLFSESLNITRTPALKSLTVLEGAWKVLEESDLDHLAGE